MVRAIDFIQLMTAFGALNGVLGAVVLWRLPQRKKANIFLAIMLLVLGVLSLGSFMNYSGFFFRFPKTQKLYAPFFFAFGPLLYFYSVSLTGVPEKWKSSRLLHFIPVAAHFLYNIPFYLKSDAEKRELFQEGFLLDARIIRYLVFIQFTIYAWFVLRRIRIGYLLAKDQISSLQRVRFKWIGAIALVHATVILVSLIPHMSESFLSPVFWCWEACMVILLFYKGMTQPELILVESERIAALADKHEVIQKTWMEMIDSRMMKHCLYRDPDLTLEKLARNCRLRPEQCSQAINRQKYMNFFQYVNGFRVEEVKKRLDIESSNRSILKIALDAGFNSKSTFNAIFKSMVGMTPSEYKKLISKRLD